MPVHISYDQRRSTSVGDVNSLLSSVPVATLRVEYKAADTVYFPSAPAGIWRGQLGAALRRAAQARSKGEGASPYEQLFRTPRSAVRVPDRPMRILGPVGLAGEHVPHPFTLRMVAEAHCTAPHRLEPGDTTAWCLSLVGTAVRHLPALAAALDGLGQDGIGRAVPQSSGPDRRGALRLHEATLRTGRVFIRLYDGCTWRLPEHCSAALYEQASHLLEPSPPGAEGESSGTLRVSFKTPVRLNYQGALLTEPSALTAEALAQACYRRWAALALCYAPSAPSTEQLDATFRQARALGETTKITERGLAPAQRTRYSARQDQRLSRTGLVGAFHLTGPPARLQTWRNWLTAAVPLHIGKSTSMGFGRFTVAS